MIPASIKATVARSVLDALDIRIGTISNVALLESFGDARHCSS